MVTVGPSNILPAVRNHLFTSIIASVVKGLTFDSVEPRYHRTRFCQAGLEIKDQGLLRRDIVLTHPRQFVGDGDDLVGVDPP